jgi:hypothetical protein
VSRDRGTRHVEGEIVMSATTMARTPASITASITTRTTTRTTTSSATAAVASGTATSADGVPEDVQAGTGWVPCRPAPRARWRAVRPSVGGTLVTRVRHLRELGTDAGMATAEYAIATLAAVGFAGLLVVILKGNEVKAMLMALVRQALAS